MFQTEENLDVQVKLKEWCPLYYSVYLKITTISVTVWVCTHVTYSRMLTVSEPIRL